MLFSNPRIELSKGLFPSGFAVRILDAVLILSEKTEEGKHGNNEKRQEKEENVGKKRRE
jgi:hypothetical protein